MRSTGEPLISEAIVEAAKHRVAEAGRLEAKELMRVREPHFYAALCKLSIHAMDDRDEAIDHPTQTAICDALWRGAEVAVEAYRIAHFQLCAGTVLGTRLAQIDADLARRAAGDCGDKDDSSAAHSEIKRGRRDGE
jgi:hypothetical protein